MLCQYITVRVSDNANATSLHFPLQYESEKISQCTEAEF